MRTLVLAALLASTPALARPAPTHDDATALVKAGDMDGAYKAYKALTKSNPDDARAWYMLGYVELQRARYDKAIAAYKTAKDKGFYPQVVNYDLACAHAQAGATDAAFAALEAATAAGYRDIDHILADPDLAPLRALEAWEEVLADVDRNVRPCTHDAAYRAFDFWLGTWEVRDDDGIVAGHNQVVAEEEGCVVTERWTGTLGGTGRSFTYLDPADGRWHQDWVSSGGGVIHYAGALTEAGGLDLVGTRTVPGGTPGPSRCVWTPQPDGTVHQTFYKQAEDGAWVKTSNLVYARAAE